MVNNNVDKQYLELLKTILDSGVEKKDRTGTGTKSIFDYTMKFNMDEGFPLLTSKKMFTKAIVHELIWFLSGDTNIKYLLDNNVNIWTGDAYKKYTKTNITYLNDNEKNYGLYLSEQDFIAKIKSDESFCKKWGDLGPVYGSQWKDWGGHYQLVEVGAEYFGGSFGGAVQKMNGLMENIKVKGIDQIERLITDLKNNPDSRRLMVSAWNVADVDSMTLPPCHYGFQCYTQEMDVEERSNRWCSSLSKDFSYGEDMTHEKLDQFGFPKRKLSLKWTQRSCDVLLGVPFNIASYALLLHLLAKEVNMIASDLIFSGGDVHIYLNHIDQAKEQLGRSTYKLPTLKLNNESIDSLKYEDVELINYQSDKILKAELSN